MPSEPEKPVEKLLRSWSKARRERGGQSWEIHPATRRIWHREVERRFGSGSEAKRSWLARLAEVGWLRPAGAAAGIAFVAVFSWALLSRPAARPTGEIASVNRAPAPLAQASPAEATSADKSEEALKNDDGLEKSKKLLAANSPTERQLDEKLQQKVAAAKDGGVPSQSFQDHAAAAPAAGTPVQLAKTEPSPAPAPAATTATVDAEKAFAARYGMRGGAETRNARDLSEADAPSGSAASLAANPAAVPGVSSEVRAPVAGILSTNVIQYGFFAASQTASAPPNTDRLNRRASSALASSPSKQTARNSILATFRIEQTGQELRIIDSDGSVYAGPILQNQAQIPGLAPSAMVRNALESQAVKVDALSLQAPAREVANFFQVAGTNLRSQQRVIFSGALLGSTNMAGTGGEAAQAGRGFGGAVMLAQTNTLGPNLRVSGTAIIGGNQQLHIEATPVPR